MTDQVAPPPTIVLPAVPPNVFVCIENVTAELARQGIAKDRTNVAQNYKFRGIDEVYNALAPLLAKHHLVIIPRMLDREVTEREARGGGLLFCVVLAAEFAFTSTADGSSTIVRTYGEAMDSGDKATSKAMSAAYKYAALMTFAIPTEGDHDAENSSPEAVAPPKPPAGFDEWFAAVVAAPDTPALNKLWKGDERVAFREYATAQRKTQLAAARAALTAKKAAAK